jgi:hypothetical protein
LILWLSPKGLIVAVKLVIKNGKLDGEAERRPAERGAEITILLLVIDTKKDWSALAAWA